MRSALVDWLLNAARLHAEELDVGRQASPVGVGSTDVQVDDAAGGQIHDLSDRGVAATT